MSKAVVRVTGTLALLPVLATITLLGIAFGPTLMGAESQIVTSGSMGRAMPVGSVAVTRLVDAHSIGVGDIITFRTPTGTTSVTHRVISVQRDAGGVVFHTKGDANPAADPQPVRVADRIHRVERVVPYAGWIVHYARTPAGLVALLVVPILGLLHDRRRARAASTKGEQVVVPSVVAPAPPAPRPSPLLGAMVGVVAGGIAVGALLHLANRPPGARPSSGR